MGLFDFLRKTKASDEKPSVKQSVAGSVETKDALYKEEHNEISAGNWDFFIACVGQGNLNGVKSEFSKGIDLNKKEGSMTPLMIASYHGHLEIVRFLVQQGANTTIVNSDGKTASDLADNQQIRMAINMQSVQMKYAKK